ncbi:Fe-S cluster assembly sulfur transfer protein SufU [Enterococcus sp. JM9B]|uniref:Fe-S cluster assembly sulfur transfer protein SufU n=1 Tax=Enterococcus sp. JM9B TaxID=1857216 RepID=UPI0013750708|nr:SUF system NifU family Fe-S cluster assembly protein [Enterococcus sp. JM9B]KAF1305005.1 SUF system NifU family Fe-S cluster assembly protein [Enterococcus sp. JM9B]
MALSKLDNLYRQVILDHSSHPHHHGSLAKADQAVEMNNPTCGDVIHLELAVEDGIITGIAFDGSGCSISTASASMMTDAVLGKSVTEAEELITAFSELVQGNETPKEEELGEAAVLSGVAKFPARIKCATLAWKALGQAVESNGVAETGHLHQPEDSDHV